METQITYEMLKADAEGEMVLLRQICRLEMKVANGEASYDERRTFYAIEDMMKETDVRQLYFNLYDNMVEFATA